MLARNDAIVFGLCRDTGLGSSRQGPLGAVGFKLGGFLFFKRRPILTASLSVDRKSQQHVARRGAEMRVAGVDVEHAVDNDGARPIE